MKDTLFEFSSFRHLPCPAILLFTIIKRDDIFPYAHFRLLRRTDTKGQRVFERPNASSPVVIDNLRPATPYTLFVSGSDGSDAHATPFELTEHFTTLETSKNLLRS